MSDYISWLRSKVGHEPVVLVGVSAVIQNGHGKVLLVRRADNNTWACPGGILEPGENARETISREISEELKARISVGDCIGVYTDRGAFSYPNGDVSHIVGIFFVCTLLDEPKPDESEILEANFFDKDSLPDSLWDKHRQPIEDFFNGVRGVIR